MIWCKRVITWDKHVRRGAKYKHICACLLEYNNNSWLMLQRSRWVPTDGDNIRNSIFAGRTGTRCNIGRPQVRWEAGVTLARELIQSRGIASRGGNAISIGTRIRNTFAQLTSAAQQSFNDQFDLLPVDEPT